jgi:hypothetical protein
MELFEQRLDEKASDPTAKETQDQREEGENRVVYHSQDGTFG